MNTLKISQQTELILPKMGIMTNLLELSRHDYIYVKDNLNRNQILSIEKDETRFWNKDALAIYHKGFKLGYLNSSIGKIVSRLINRFGAVKVSIQNMPQNTNPFSGMDILIQIS